MPSDNDLSVFSQIQNRFNFLLLAAITGLKQVKQFVKRKRVLIYSSISLHGFVTRFQHWMQTERRKSCPQWRTDEKQGASITFSLSCHYLFWICRWHSVEIVVRCRKRVCRPSTHNSGKGLRRFFASSFRIGWQGCEDWSANVSKPVAFLQNI